MGTVTDLHDAKTLIAELEEKIRELGLPQGAEFWASSAKYERLSRPLKEKLEALYRREADDGR